MLQTISCQGALKLLEDVPEAQLIDIRPKEDLRSTGSPDLRTVNKSPINVAYKPKVEPTDSGSQISTITIGWAERLCRNGKVRTATAASSHRDQGALHVRDS